MKLATLMWATVGFMIILMLSGCLTDADVAKLVGAPDQLVQISAANQNCSDFVDDAAGMGHCLEQKAVARNDVSFCDQIYSGDVDATTSKYDCYVTLSARGNTNYCNRLGSFMAGNVNACYSEVAHRKMDMGTCLSISEVSISDSCISAIASSANNSAQACPQKDGEPIVGCVAAIAADTHGRDYCQEIYKPKNDFIDNILFNKDNQIKKNQKDCQDIFDRNFIKRNSNLPPQ